MKKLFALILSLILVLSFSPVAGVSEEKVSLKVAYPGNIQAFIEGEDENNNFIIDYIESGTGIDVEWILIDVPPISGAIDIQTVFFEE